MLYIFLKSTIKFLEKAKGLVVELAPIYAQSVWGSSGERVQAVGLITCNYLSSFFF